MLLNAKDELMMPGIRHLLSLGYGKLHVHGRHRDGALSDPACEPGDQSDQSPRVEVEEAPHYLPLTGLLCPLDELGMSGTLKTLESIL